MGHGGTTWDMAGHFFELGERAAAGHVFLSLYASACLHRREAGRYGDLRHRLYSTIRLDLGINFESRRQIIFPRFDRLTAGYPDETDGRDEAQRAQKNQVRCIRLPSPRRDYSTPLFFLCVLRLFAANTEASPPPADTIDIDSRPALLFRLPSPTCRVPINHSKARCLRSRNQLPSQEANALAGITSGIMSVPSAIAHNVCWRERWHK